MDRELTAKIKAWLVAGLKPWQIKKKLRSTNPAMSGRISKHRRELGMPPFRQGRLAGLPPKKEQLGRVRTAKKMRKKGATLGEIGAVLNVSRQRVHQMCKEPW